MFENDKYPIDYDRFTNFFTSSNRGGGGRGYGGNQGGGGGRRRRGRPVVSYPVNISRSIDTHQGFLELTTFEMKLLELADMEQADGSTLSQEEIAQRLEVSQTTVWRYLKALRKKITQAIINHNEIHVRIIDKEKNTY
ncbi:MAG: HTH domain-containing protein [Candidatus Lokiarchaeota archaeon]|nr:HTH domain-containing protein [Candidatus Lokiarchaeota archaeon]